MTVSIRRLALLWRIALLLGLIIALIPSPGSANGGQIQVDGERIGPYRVSVFTEPVPLQVGPVDVSVLVEDPDSGAVVEQELPITVTAEPAEGDASPVSHAATREQASQPERYRSAEFEINSEGHWRFTVEVDGPDGGGQTRFEADVSGASFFSQRNQLILAVILVPIVLGLLWWLFFSGGGDEEDQSSENSA